MTPRPSLMPSRTASRIPEPPIALNTDNYAANHAPDVAEAIGGTLHVRTTLGRPKTDAPVEGAFGLTRGLRRRP